MFEDDGPEETTPITDPLADVEPPELDPDLPDGEFHAVKDTDDENELCDCGPENRESDTVQKGRGVTLGAIGGQYTEEVSVIVCTDCGQRFYEDEADQAGDGFNSLP